MFLEMDLFRVLKQRVVLKFACKVNAFFLILLLAVITFWPINIYWLDAQLLLSRLGP